MSAHAVRAIMVKDNQLLVMSRNKFGHKYYTLIGGHVDLGETPEEALIREVEEETSLIVKDPKLVYIDQSVKPYGNQYVYTVDYQGGEVKLSPDSGEAKINELKKNLYMPMWLDIDKLPNVPFLSTELKDHLIKDLANGFGSEVVAFSSVASYETKEEIQRRDNGQD